MKITDIYNDILSRKFRSAWGRGVAQYALELLHDLADNGEEEYNGSPYDHRALLNGASCWQEYSEAAVLSSSTATSQNASAPPPSCAATTSDACLSVKHDDEEPDPHKCKKRSTSYEMLHWIPAATYPPGPSPVKYFRH